jgi:ABC-type transport system substrate-binding protein
VDYEPFGAEVVDNVYQTLVSYNGSSTTSFLPELATCVPGSDSCSDLYGSDLVVNDTYWTFVLDKDANFYDPSTGRSWGVYPTDVMASLARTMALADLPTLGSSPGWIQAQSVLQDGNPSFDTGIHFPLNNTGASVLSSMFINDTSYCPAAAMASEHGCITFNATGSGQLWPFFLALVAEPLGAGIEPCGWFAYVGAGIPGFTTNAAKGDGPCLLPDGGTTTNSTAWTSYLASITPSSSSGFKAWDNFELNALNRPGVFSQTRFTAVGSGPYYVVSVERGIGYVLQANPAYQQPNCAIYFACEPAPGDYASIVNTFWEPTDQVGIQEYVLGHADFATISTQDYSTMLALEQSGKIGIESVPSLTFSFDPINMAVDTSSLSGYYSGPYNLPPDVGGVSGFFSYVGVRQFLVNSFPYTQDLEQVLSVDGIHLGVNFGGAIPRFIDGYYPSNVSWPAGEPDLNSSDVGGAAWWWAQANNVSSPYYDPYLGDCTASTPCQFPVEGEVGAPEQDQQFPLWAGYISSISGGRVRISQEVDLQGMPTCYALTTPCQFSPLTISVASWVTDYADPTDTSVPLYAPDSTYPSLDSVAEALESDSSPTCPSGGTWANLSYWAHQFGVPQVCQGDAYSVMAWADAVAGAMPLGTERALYYNLVSHIANDLALYLYQFQAQQVVSYSSWIIPNSIDYNPLAGTEWFSVEGNGLLP